MDKKERHVTHSSFNRAHEFISIYLYISRQVLEIQKPPKSKPNKKDASKQDEKSKKKKKVIRRFYIQYINVVNKSNEIFPKESKMTKEKCMFIRRMFMCVCVCIFFGVVLMTL